jgi:hypothetical protein
VPPLWTVRLALQMSAAAVAAVPTIPYAEALLHALDAAVPIIPRDVHRITVQYALTRCMYRSRSLPASFCVEPADLFVFVPCWPGAVCTGPVLCCAVLQGRSSTLRRV